MPHVEANLDQTLRSAIENMRLIQFEYQGRDRIAEPHDYGEKNGVVKLLVYQVGGSSSHPLPNWRWVDVDAIAHLRILDRTFHGGRPIPSGKHNNWDKLYVRVKPATQPAHQWAAQIPDIL